MNITRRDFIKTVAATGFSSTIFGCAIPAISVRERMALDLVIKHGTIIDGTGAAGRPGDIGIRDGEIWSIGNLEEATAEQVIDARGLTVVPGFIDIHSHVDVELFRDPRAESKVHQGVTTEVNGCDGDSPAPLGGPGLERTLSHFKERFGFDCPYRDMDGFLSLLEEGHCAQNIVSLVGLGTVRGVIVGEENRLATPDELDRMKREVARAIEQGCWGTSTGLEYTPGSFAAPDELIELVHAAPAKYRLYATHMRNEDNRLLEAIEEAIAIARGSGGRLQVSHLKASYKANWYKQEKAMKLLDGAIASGLDVHADRYPYIAYATDLETLFPLWAREGGTEAFLSRLKSAEDLGKIKSAVVAKIDSLGSWASVMISEVHTDGNKKYQGKTIEEISKETGQDPFSVTVGLLQQEDDRVSMVGFGMDEAGTEMVLAWKNTMIASEFWIP